MIRKLVLLAVLPIAAFSQDEPKLNALYIHPASAIVTTAVDGVPAYLTITYERMLEEGRSISFQPSLMIGALKQDEKTFEGNKLQPPDIDIVRIAGFLGARKYLNNSRTEGVYLGPSLGLEFSQAHQSAKVIRTTTTNHYWLDEEVSAFGVAGLGYIGYRGLWGNITLFVDAGLGYRYVSASNDNDQSKKASATGLAFDAGLGIGFPF